MSLKFQLFIFFSFFLIACLESKFIKPITQNGNNDDFGFESQEMFNDEEDSSGIDDIGDDDGGTLTPRYTPEFSNGCGNGEFQCDNGECIQQYLRCSGSPECADGSDEKECDYCPENKFKCYSGECLELEVRCNGINDCQDSSDEYSCQGGNVASCLPEEFQCGDGSCIQPQLLCNGHYECSDGSDESDCFKPKTQNGVYHQEGQCSSNEFTCNNQQCVSSSLRCDQKADCQDGSDELECFQTNPLAPSYHECDFYRHFECGPGVCIDKHLLCNGANDCPGSLKDEENCQLEARPGSMVIREGTQAQVVCLSRGNQDKPIKWLSSTMKPLPSNWREDGKGNLTIYNAQPDQSGQYICKYEDDEHGRYRGTALITIEHLIGPTQSPFPPQHGVCPKDSFFCGSGKCIPNIYVCDGDYDCEDRSDESNCGPKDCEVNEMRCSESFKCISKIWQCDGDYDCGGNDKSDEMGCDTSNTTSGCRKNEFKCIDKHQCIPLGYQCDGHPDCLDQSDEKGCIIPTVPKSMPALRKGLLGSEIILECEAQGIPAPIIVWRLNWGKLSGQPPRVITEQQVITPYSNTLQIITVKSRLIFKELSTTDEGAYSCEVINAMGNKFATPDTTLIVEKNQMICHPPEFNDGASHASECKRCWCSGVTNQCSSAPDHYFALVEIDVISGLTDRNYPGFSDHDDGKLPETRSSQFIESQSIPNFSGNKLNLYGGYFTYDLEYVSEESPHYSPPYQAAAIENTDGKKIYYFLERLPEPNKKNNYKIYFLENGWYSDDKQTQPVSREEFLSSLSKLRKLYIAYRYVDSFNKSVVTNLKMTLHVSHDANTGRAYLVEKCECPPGYTGLSCESCETSYKRDPITNKCLPSCNCHGHSNECELGGYGYYCKNCQHHTSGHQCEKCETGYYGDATKGSPYDCQPCNCPKTSDNKPGGCSLRGNEIQCDRCPQGAYGPNCELCHRDYALVNNYCQKATACHRPGTHDIDPRDNICKCKMNVEGESCNRCKPGFFNLDERNQEGCSPCFCSGLGTSCVEARNLYYQTLRVDLESKLPDFDNLNLEGDEDTLEVQGIEKEYDVEPGVVYIRPENFPATLYWILPFKFHETLPTLLYGSTISYKTYSEPLGNSPPNYKPDLILVKTSGERLFYAQNEKKNERNWNNVNMTLIESNFKKQNGYPVSKAEFLDVLKDFSHILIKAQAYQRDALDKVKDIQIRRFINVPTNEGLVRNFQQCNCPPGFSGYFCEKVECPLGFYHNPLSNQCEECKCSPPYKSIEKGYGCRWSEAMKDYVCTVCPEGFQGPHCNMCSTGYVGYPEESYGQCIKGNDQVQNPRRPEPDLDIDLEPKFTTNQNVVLKCGLSGTMPMAIKWYREGGPLPPNAFVDSQSFNLHIKNIQPSDVGFYYCEAYNLFGENRLKYLITLEVDNKPQIYLDQSTPNPQIGEPFSVRCLTKNYVEKAEYTWKKNNGPMRAYTYSDGSLVFTELKREDEGEYVCQLDSQQGGAQIVFYLRFADQPEIKEYSASRGDFITLKCDPSSNQYYGNIYWLKDGHLLSDPRMRSDQPGQLDIVDVQIEDAGEYTCVFNTTDNRQFKITSRLVIDGGLPYQDLIVGQELNLVCSVSHTRVPVVWYKDNSQNLGPRAEITSDYLLIIKSVTQEDSGLYSCSFTTPEGQHINQSTIINIKNDPRPIIDQGHTVFQGHINAPVVLTCKVYGEEPLTVKWLKDSQTPGQDTYYNNQDHSLTIYRFGEHHQGTWSCIAENRHGSASKHITLSVSSDRNNKFEKRPGDYIEFECLFPPGVNIDWTKDFKALPPHAIVINNGQKLIIEKLSYQDAGVYTCRAFTNQGVMEKNYEIILDYKNSGKTEDLVLKQVPVNSDVTLSCSVEGTVQHKTSWNWNERPVHADNIYVDEKNFLNILRVRQDQEGNFTCLIETPIGTFKQITQLVVYNTDAPGFENPVYIKGSKIVNVPKGGSTQLQCITKADFESEFIFWERKDGKPLNEKFVELGNGILLIENMEANDSGTYVCIVVDRSNNKYFAEAELRIDESENQIHVSVPPDSNILEGEPFSAQCHLGGFPQEAIQWKFKGRSVNSHYINSGSQLFIPRVTQENEGEYECFSQTNQGYYSARFYLNVQRANYPVSLRPIQGDISEFDPVQLSCRTNAKEEVRQIEWSKYNGSLPNDADQYTVNDEQTLYIPRCRKEDEGRYVCTVYYINGQKEVLYYTLQLPKNQQSYRVVSELGNYKLKISPSEAKLTLGSGLKIECKLDGPKDFNYQYKWFLNEHPIQNEHSQLVINSLNSNDFGTYSCKVLTPLGMLTSNSVVQLISSPNSGLVLEPRGEVHITEGESLDIWCANYENPSSLVVLEGPSKQISTGTSEVSLSVVSVEPKHGGSYTCQSRGLASDLTDSVVVTVAQSFSSSPTHAVHSAVTINPQHLSLPETQDSTLTCLGGGEDDSYIWAKKDDYQNEFEELRESNVYPQNNMLYILNANNKNTGLYRCQVLRNSYFIGEANAKIEIIATPNLRVEPQTIQPTIGQEVELKCSLSEGGPAKYTWYRENGEPLSQQAKFIHDEGKLLIENIQESDSGVYVCQARNNAGSTETKAVIEVQGSLYVEITPNGPYVEEGDSVELTCMATGDQPITYNWEKSEGDLPRNAQMFGNKLRLNSLTTEDSGFYRCNAVNKYGSSFNQAFVSVVSKDSNNNQVLRNRKVVERGQNIDITCEILSYNENKATLKWEKVNGDLSPNAHVYGNIIRLLDANEYDQGIYQCSLLNPSTNQLQVAQVELIVV